MTLRSTRTDPNPGNPELTEKLRGNPDAVAALVAARLADPPDVPVRAAEDQEMLNAWRAKVRSPASMRAAGMSQQEIIDALRD